MSPRKGFTLIEILIVVAIIGLLASVVLVGLGPAQRRGRDARRLSDLKSVQNALELYYNKCGHYPGDASCNLPAGGAIPWNTLAATLTSAGIGVAQIPNDPASSKKYEYATNDDGTTYILAATLEDENNNVFNQTFVPPGDVTGINCVKPVYCMVF